MNTICSDGPFVAAEEMTEEEVKRFCTSTLRWLKPHQKKKCREEYSHSTVKPMLNSIHRGVTMALTECENHFNDHRWNCSGLNTAQVFQDQGILKTGKYKLLLFTCLCTVDSIPKHHNISVWLDPEQKAFHALKYKSVDPNPLNISACMILRPVNCNHFRIKGNSRTMYQFVRTARTTSCVTFYRQQMEYLYRLDRISQRMQ